MTRDVRMRQWTCPRAFRTSADATLRVAADTDTSFKVVNCALCACLINVDFQFQFWNQLIVL